MTTHNCLTNSILSLCACVFEYIVVWEMERPDDFFVWVACTPVPNNVNTIRNHYTSAMVASFHFFSGLGVGVGGFLFRLPCLSVDGDLLSCHFCRIFYLSVMQFVLVCAVQFSLPVLPIDNKILRQYFGIEVWQTALMFILPRLNCFRISDA